MTGNPFWPPSSLNSFNRVRIADLPGLALDPDVRGATAYELVSALALQNLIRQQAAPLKLDPTSADLPRQLSMCLDSSEAGVRAAAEEVRMEVETVWHLHHASRRRLELAAKRQDLLASMLNTVKMRAEHGLATPVSVLTAEMEVLRQDSAYSEALSDRRTREFHLMAVCGVEEDGNLMAQNQTNGGGKSHDD